MKSGFKIFFLSREKLKNFKTYIYFWRKKEIIQILKIAYHNQTRYSMIIKILNNFQHYLYSLIFIPIVTWKASDFYHNSVPINFSVMEKYQFTAVLYWLNKVNYKHQLTSLTGCFIALEMRERNVLNSKQLICVYKGLTAAGHFIAT